MNPVDRRTFLRLAGAGLGVAGLSACAGTGSSGSGGGGASSGPVTNLTFWSNHPGTSKPVETELINTYKAGGGIDVALVDGGANYEELAQKFNAALTGNDVPDIVVVSDVTWFNLALNDAITPVDDLWGAAGADSSAYVDTLREDYAFEGKHYAVPYARSTPLFYYNKAMWRSAGLPDRGPETWQEFADWGPALLDANGGKAPLTVPNGRDYLDWYFQGMIWTFGGAYSEEWEPAFTSPESLAAGRFLQEQVQRKHINVTNDASNQFGAGQAASLMQSTGTLRGLAKTAAFEFGAAPLPGPTPGCPTGGAGLAIPNKISDARKEAAMRFITSITDTKNTVTFTQATGYLPVRKNARDEPVQQQFLAQNPNATVALEQLADTKPQDFARVFVPGGGSRIGAGLDRITSGGEDVQKVFGELADETRTVYERDVEPKL